MVKEDSRLLGKNQISVFLFTKVSDRVVVFVPVLQAPVLVQKSEASAYFFGSIYCSRKGIMRLGTLNPL